MIKVVIGMMKDIGAFCSLEIKAQEYPIPQDELKSYMEDPSRCAYLASIQGRKIGAALIQTHVDYTTVVRVSVHPEFRHLGVSKQLMFEVEKNAWKAKHKLLRMHIPSYKADNPNDPDYIGWWLEKNHFKVVKCVSRSFWRYGKWWDAYIFERPL